VTTIFDKTLKRGYKINAHIFVQNLFQLQKVKRGSERLYMTVWGLVTIMPNNRGQDQR
jgi:hypothetical protein